MHQVITGICVLLLVSRCMGGPMVEGDEAEGQVMNHRDDVMGTMGTGGPVAGQKSGEAPVYGLMRYFSYLSRTSTNNGQILQAMKGILTEVTDTRVKVDQMNEKLDLILTRITVVQAVQVPQETAKPRSSGFTGFKLFN